MRMMTSLVLTSLFVGKSASYALPVNRYPRHPCSHFCNIGSKVSSTIQNAKFHFSSFLKTPQDRSSYLEMTNVNEVISEINKPKTKKAAGHDGIKPMITKKSCLVLSKPLTHIYNASFETGVMPSIWKMAKVIPIFKNGERYDPNNYRPISLLSCFEKLLERLLAKRIISFLSSMNYNSALGRATQLFMPS